MKVFDCPLCPRGVSLPSIKSGTYAQWVRVAAHLTNDHSIFQCPCDKGDPLASHLGGIGSFKDAKDHLRFYLMGDRKP